MWESEADAALTTREEGGFSATVDVGEARGVELGWRRRGGEETADRCHHHSRGGLDRLRRGDTAAQQPNRRGVDGRWEREGRPLNGVGAFDGPSAVLRLFGSVQL